VLGGLVTLLLVGFYLPSTLLAPLGTAAVTTIDHQVLRPGPPPITYPQYGASAFGAVGYDGVLGTAGSAAQLPIASITKVVVALVVLETFPLEQGEEGPTMTFDDTDVQYFEDQIVVDGTRQPVAAGSSLSEHDVLELMLIASANNYALSLTRWAFGTPEAFIAAATTWLSEHGLSTISIREPTGLDPANVGTANDLVALGKLALEHPVVAAIVGTPVTEVPGIGAVQNRNVLLGVDGIDGIKTGTLDESGANLLFSADRTIGSEVVTIVGVVLGGPDQETVRGAVQSILASAAVGFQSVTLAPAGEDWGEYGTAWGDTASAVTADALQAVVWDGAAIDYTSKLEDVRLAATGTDVGDLTFTVGGRTFTTDLVLDATIDDPGPWWRLTHPFELF
jgi:D-alanyl-D-alanine carboxypeptidase (penicillin-binding protein 5/6)